MRSLATTLLATLLLAGGCRLRMQPVTDPASVEHPSVVSVVAWHAGFTPSGGVSTGTYVAPRTVLTCCHGVEGRSEVCVRLADGRQVRMLAVLGADLARDIALLQVEPVANEPAPVPLASSPPSPGAALMSVGTSGARAQTTARLRLVGHEASGPNAARLKFQVLDGRMEAGASGSPVIDEQGHVAGVIVRMSVDGRHGWAEPASSVQGLDTRTRMEPAAWARSSAPSPERRLDLQEQDAWKALLSGEPTKAERGARAVLAADPNRTLARRILVGALSEQNRDAEALAAALEAQQLAPDDVDVRREVGGALANVGRLAEARERLESVLALRPDDVQAWDFLVRVHAQRGDRDAAQAALAQVRRLNPAAARASERLLSSRASARPAR